MGHVRHRQPGARWCFELTSIAGATRLRYTLKLGPGPSGINAAIEAMPDKEPRIIHRRLEEHRANMQRVVDGVKAATERDDDRDDDSAALVSDTGFFVDLERRVWDALVTGDEDADRAALTDDFVGVYPTGFADAHQHAEQLADGPTVATYRIDSARTLAIADGHVVLAYLATYRRPGSDADESMYVSSLWSLRAGRWQNVFRQDTPVGDSVV